MLGYLLVSVIGLIILSLLLVGLVRTSPRSGHLPGTPSVQTNTPAADEPTPDRSVTAKPKLVRAARQHTPPA